MVNTQERGSQTLKITINQQEHITETEVTITCRQTDEHILRMVASLQAFDKKITGLREGQTFLLAPGDILYCDIADRRSFLYTAEGVYETPLKLYELLDRLSQEDFFRATKSSVVNFSKIKSLRPDFGGRLTLTMENGEQLTVSRQFVPDVKKKLYMEDTSK